MQPNHHTLAPVSRDSMGILSAWTCHIHSCNHREHSCSSFLKPYGHYGGILTTPSVYIKLCSVRVFRVCVRPLPLFTQPVQQKGCVNILKLGYGKGKMPKRTNHSEAALWLVEECRPWMCRYRLRMCRYRLWMGCYRLMYIHPFGVKNGLWIWNFI